MVADDKETAVATCTTCPQRLPCLRRALRRNEPAGIWGGIDFESQLARTKGEAGRIRRQARALLAELVETEKGA